MKNFTNQLATVSALGFGDGVEDCISFNSDFRAEIAQLGRHVLGSLLASADLVRSSRSLSKVINAVPRDRSLSDDPARNVRARLTFAVKPGDDSALTNTKPASESQTASSETCVTAESSDVVGKRHWPIIFTKGVGKQALPLTAAVGDFTERLPHNLCMADNKYTDTTIIRGLWRTEQAPRLKEARKAHQMSQSELAKALNWPPSTIGMYEQGSRGLSFESAQDLERYFQVAAEWWMGSLTAKEAALVGLERGLKGQIHEPQTTARHDIHPPHSTAKAHRKPPKRET